MILLTKEERDEAYDKLPNNATVGDERIAMCEAQVKKMVDTLKSKAVKAWGGNVIILEEDWQALLKEGE